MEPPEISICAIVGDGLRHRYFGNELAARFRLTGLVSETKRSLPTGGPADDGQVVREHFRQRDDAEKRYFGGNDSFNLADGKLLRVGHRESNQPQVFEWVKLRQPDYVVLFGSSIIREPLLSHFGGRVINMHLGLSPYYRGSGTNFWPLVNREPEYVGTTIHLATLDVDGGPILAQCRPQVEMSDGCHDFGCKSIAAGVRLMARCIHDHSHGRLQPHPQKPGGAVYRNSDFNAGAVRRMWDNFEAGMVREYLGSLESRHKNAPIVEIG